ncbi:MULTISPECIES: sodium:proton antiporter [Pseudomonas]|uniref:Sodium/hydrogen exchanger protein n=2 Tax=Pseudomonas syringae group TaxID=136849 RepID=A0A3M4IXM2_PSEVI|nr:MULTISPECIES: sodium:proton antiporter [Pseudomonas]KTB73104.1 sodium:proton antiporter [Pseudomonas sp. ICMP 3272]KTC54659.1 sodium:proton antiporter [Pseudomonas syringae ICMP 19498]RMO96570.1 Sodium/hydrogen exchanger protein [Pseudomonas syringae pv. persicae]RMQ09035.1 Sodium/hydrogen exchanger protein [Pseudomonas viridiflava]RMQ71745.1 Sodium/hydrogen exchanger protein [Pseudomonas viridiflava]
MSFIVCMGVLGVLLMLLALTSSYLRWMPVTTSAVCLGFGFGIGPMGLDIVNLDFEKSYEWLERLTEVAVLFSLFGTGIKLRLPLRGKAWHSAYWLAGPVMLATIAGVTVAGHYIIGLDWGVSLLLGAMLSPTDPVLAGMVQVNNAQDQDRLRFGLSGEAGLNDGTAFPFVIFALLYLSSGGAMSDWVQGWLIKDLIWAVPAGLLIGYGMGRGVGHLMIFLRIKNADSTTSPNDFLALALIALAYVVAQGVGAFGFLSVFTAGFGLRQAEVRVTRSELPSEHVAQPVLGHMTASLEQGTVAQGEDMSDSQLAAGVMMGDMLAFGSLVERAMEVLLITLLGAALAMYWDWRAIGLGLALFCVIRPASVWLLVSRRLLNGRQKALVGWFGIRGIGSLYYLCFALSHGLAHDVGHVVIGMTLSVVALSILVHGISIQPLLERYERSAAANPD